MACLLGFFGTAVAVGVGFCGGVVVAVVVVATEETLALAAATCELVAETFLSGRTEISRGAVGTNAMFARNMNAASIATNVSVRYGMCGMGESNPRPQFGKLLFCH